MSNTFEFTWEVALAAISAFSIHVDTRKVRRSGYRSLESMLYIYMCIAHFYSFRNNDVSEKTPCENGV